MYVFVNPILACSKKAEGKRSRIFCTACINKQTCLPVKLRQVQGKGVLVCHYLCILHWWGGFSSSAQTPHPSRECLILGQDFQAGLLVINQKCICYVVLIYIYLMLKVICDHLSVFQHMESGNNRFQLHAVKRDCVSTRHNVVYWVLIITN